MAITTRFSAFFAIYFIAACSTLPKASAPPAAPSTSEQALHATPVLEKLHSTEEKPADDKISKWLELDHKYFKIFYDPKLRLARYVRYETSADILSQKNVKRHNPFRADPVLIESGHAFVMQDEYKYSGYDRGHMAPSEDFVFSREANDETFVMSNMAPQSKNLNRHAWARLEGHVRKWICGEGHGIVITGPVIEEGLPTLKSGLPIPKRFFKIVIVDKEPRKALGFLYSQNDVKDVYQQRVVKISEIEELIHEHFENEVPLQDQHIFSDEPKFDNWKEAKCGR